MHNLAKKKTTILQDIPNKAITGRPGPANISGFFRRQGGANGSLSGDSFRLAFYRFFLLFIITFTSYYFYFYFSSSLSRLFLLRYELLFRSLGGGVGLPGKVGGPALVRGYPSLLVLPGW